jgi:hypothetical protein
LINRFVFPQYSQLTDSGSLSLVHSGKFGDRLGLRPGAVSLVQKAEKPQDPEQQTLDLDPKPDAPTKYARVKLKGDKFDGQVFAVVKGNELGSTLLTPNGYHWFRTDCLEFIDPSTKAILLGELIFKNRV